MSNANFLTTTNFVHNTRIYLLGLCALAFLLSSCASTSVKNTWKASDLREPVGKIAVLTVDQRGLLRKGFENRLQAQLVRAGTPAMVTYDHLALEDIKQDKGAAAAHLQSKGAEAVLILRLVDVDKSYRESQPGGERYAASVTGIGQDFGYAGWYDFYTVSFMNMNSVYGTLKQTVLLEAGLYDLKTEKRLWFGVSKTTVTENMDRVAEMDPIVEKFVAAMRKDGVVR